MIDYKLNVEELFYALIFIFHALILFIVGAKWYLENKTVVKSNIEKAKFVLSERTKNKSYDVFRWRSSIWFGSAVISLVAVSIIMSVGIKTNDFKDIGIVFEDDFEFIPQKVHTIPLPPPPKKKEIIKKVPTKPRNIKITLAKAISKPKIFETMKVDREEAPVMSMPLVIEKGDKKKKPIVKKVKKKETVRFIAEEMPLFPGTSSNEESKEAVLDFIYKNINYPQMAIENGIEGKAVLRFVIDSLGVATDIKILKDPGGGIGLEAIKTVEKTNNLKKRWSPGKHGGKKVKVAFTLPIDFKLRD